jgi:hypothetical protein
MPENVPENVKDPSISRGPLRARHADEATRPPKNDKENEKARKEGQKRRPEKKAPSSMPNQKGAHMHGNMRLCRGARVS